VGVGVTLIARDDWNVVYYDDRIVQTCEYYVASSSEHASVHWQIWDRVKWDDFYSADRIPIGTLGVGNGMKPEWSVSWEQGVYYESEHPDAALYFKSFLWIFGPDDRSGETPTLDNVGWVLM